MLQNEFICGIPVDKTIEPTLYTLNDYMVFYDTYNGVYKVYLNPIKTFDNREEVEAFKKEVLKITKEHVKEKNINPSISLLELTNKTVNDYEFRTVDEIYGFMKTILKWI